LSSTRSNVYYSTYFMKKIYCFFIILGAMLTGDLYAQSVFPGKQTIKKKDYFGLNLNSSIPERYLGTYWEEYLDRFGKVHSRRKVFRMDRANVATISREPVEMVSKVSTSNSITQLFVAVKVSNRYVSNFMDTTYRASEQFLKDFSSFALLRDEVRLAEEYYGEADKNHQRLQRDNERIVKDIERTQKHLEDLMNEQEINKKDLAGSVLDLQNKQKDLEAAKARLPKM
jgi:hypothetical protein